MSLKQQSLTRSFFLRNLLNILFSVLALGSFWFISSYHQLITVTELLKEKAIQQQREDLKGRTNQVLNTIEYERQILQEHIYDEVRQRVDEAYAIVEDIYKQHQKVTSLDEIAVEIRAVLRTLRYNNGRDYYFALDLEGVEQVYPPAPHLEGASFLEFRDLNNKPVIQDMIRIARQDGEGPYEYTWTKPDDPHGQYEKIAYIKYFKPLNWIIGTGEYVDDIVRDLQARLIEHIEKIKFNNDNYVFVADFSGVSLSYPAKGRNMYEVEDNNGLKIVQELIAIAKQGQGFLEYVMPPLDGQRPEPKISYVAGIPDWGWYLGTGDFIADLDAEVSAMLKERKAALIQNTLMIFTILILMLLLLSYLSHRFNQQITFSFNEFREFFKRAAVDSTPLDLKKQKFVEFQQLALDANKMVEKRREAEDFLKSEELKFRTLFEHVSDYVLVLEHHDNQMVIVNLSESACQKHGYERQELIGQSITILDPSERKATQDDDRLQRLVQGETICFEITHQKKDGSTFPVASLVKMIMIDGKSFLFAIERDLTEQKRQQQQQLEMEEQLRQKYKMEAVGLMAGGMAHNFNNSLAIVLGNLEMAQRKLLQPEKLKGYLDNAHNAVLCTRDLIKQIMLYSRKGSHEKTAVQLSSIVEEALGLLRSTTPSTIKLDSCIAAAADSLQIYADSKQLQDALINLYNNALHAAQEKGVIQITLDSVTLDRRNLPAKVDRPSGCYAKLSIKDNGCGMSAAVLDKIFDPFFTTKGVGEGTGMGLPTVQGIVEEHGGFIHVISAEGQGTTFELYFPVITPAHQSMFRDSGKPSILYGSEEILLVDDDKKLLHIAAEMLVDLGYRVTAVSSGKEALELVQKNPDRFDLVVTDQVMPEMTGKELAVEIKNLNLVLPVILCSGYSSATVNDMNGDIQQFGISAYCNKPLHLVELSQVVRRVLGDSGQ